ncbi:MAG: hypothetical protein V2I25_06045 [Woeseiaceae bacterium]|jgi:hypothetical protein|nr:hypothetical protein [Woeseiaceae bacterium]
MPVVVKTFIAGLILGIAAFTGALYAIPAVDQHRENSIISVRTNGGNVERYRVSVPVDRIMIGAGGIANPVPVDLEWPEGDRFENVNVELFKLRNERDTVIGVASRVAAGSRSGEPVIEWVLHLPARGSVYATMSSEAGAGGVRTGSLRHGTREFSAIAGALAERWVPAAGDAGNGRIELEASFVRLGEDE